MESRDTFDRASRHGNADKGEAVDFAIQWRSSYLLQPCADDAVRVDVAARPSRLAES